MSPKTISKIAKRSDNMEDFKRKLLKAVKTRGKALAGINLDEDAMYDVAAYVGDILTETNELLDAFYYTDPSDYRSMRDDY